MNFDENISMLSLAFYQVLLVSGPILALALGIGLLIGIIQAATSINEMTLSFVPKVVVVMLGIGLLGNFFMILAGGWLTDKALTFIRLASGDNIDALNEFKAKLIKDLLILGGIGLTFTIGIRRILGLVGRLGACLLYTSDAADE